MEKGKGAERFKSLRIGLSPRTDQLISLSAAYLDKTKPQYLHLAVSRFLQLRTYMRQGFIPLLESTAGEEEAAADVHTAFDFVPPPGNDTSMLDGAGSALVINISETVAEQLQLEAAEMCEGDIATLMGNAVVFMHELVTLESLGHKLCFRNPINDEVEYLSAA